MDIRASDVDRFPLYCLIKGSKLEKLVLKLKPDFDTSTNDHDGDVEGLITRMIHDEKMMVNHNEDLICCSAELEEALDVSVITFNQLRLFIRRKMKMIAIREEEMLPNSLADSPKCRMRFRRPEFEDEDFVFISMALRKVFDQIPEVEKDVAVFKAWQVHDHVDTWIDVHAPSNDKRNYHVKNISNSALALCFGCDYICDCQIIYKTEKHMHKYEPLQIAH